MFLGAGASKAFGYPLTKEILPIIIITSINNNTLFKEENNNKVGKEYLFLLQQLLIALSPGLSRFFREPDSLNNGLELPLVTDLLSQIDYSLVSFRDIKDWNFEFGNEIISRPKSIRTRWELNDLKILFEWAIISTI